MPPRCALSILVARTDLPFLMHTVPHLVRMCRFAFSERVLAIDTAPLSGDKVNRPGIGTLDQLRACCEQLRAAGTIDRIVEIDYSLAYRNRIYRKHFGSTLRPTHNYKGYPILGSVFAIEEAASDYLLRFDSDMLLYQSPDHCWIQAGMRLLQQRPDVVAVRPLTGPPTADGKLHQRFPYQYDSDGFYRFKFFSSRAYLIDRRRFCQLLPLPVRWRPFRQTWLNRLPASLQTRLHDWTGRGQLDSWEVMVSDRLEQTDYVRATLASPQAWTLHPVDRSTEFFQALPELIQKIEAGWFPPEQAGWYDLQLRHWL